MTPNNLKRVTAILSHPFVNLMLRLFLGGTFILSAVTKLPHHSEFVEIVKDYDLLPNFLATGYGNALPWIELVVGVYIILGILPKFSATVIILMAFSFMLANIRSIARGEDRCGTCFGETITLPVWQAMTIDILILIAALILLLVPGKKLLFSLENLVLNRKGGENSNRDSGLEDRS